MIACFTLCGVPSGLQFAEDQDNGPVEIITTGNYYKKNGKHYILYDEVQEGFDGVTKSVIKVNDDFLDVTKKGVTNVHMMFEKNKKNMSYYNTPFGNLLVGINATDVKVNETEDNIDIKVDYKLEGVQVRRMHLCIRRTMNVNHVPFLHMI